MHIVVLSGGLDSTVTLAYALQGHAHEQVRAVSFDYGQTHRKELDAAKAVAQHYGVPHSVISLPDVFSGSALTNDLPLPLADYDEDTMGDTVVVGRNLVFASIAAALAGQGGMVWLGVHGGDHDLYPDCRPEFWRALTRLLDTTYGVQVSAPFLYDSKADIVCAGADLDVPMNLTWSCYAGGDEPCGECGTCREREAAFAAAGVVMT